MTHSESLEPIGRKQSCLNAQKLSQSLITKMNYCKVIFMKEGHNLQPSEIDQQCYKENKLTFRRRVHLDSAIVQTNKLQIKNQCTKFTHYQQHRQDIRMLSFKQ